MPQQLAAIDGRWRQIISSEAEECFTAKYADLLVCFDTTELVGAIKSYFELDGLPDYVANDFSVPTICRAMEQAFLTLLQRSALDSFVRLSPLPEAAQEQLDQMAGIKKQVSDPAADARATRQLAVDACVKAYHGGMMSQQFKSVYLTGLPAMREIYEASIASGRI